MPPKRKPSTSKTTNAKRVRVDLADSGIARDSIRKSQDLEMNEIYVAMDAITANHYDTALSAKKPHARRQRSQPDQEIQREKATAKRTTARKPKVPVENAGITDGNKDSVTAPAKQSRAKKTDLAVAETREIAANFVNDNLNGNKSLAMVPVKVPVKERVRAKIILATELPAADDESMEISSQEVVDKVTNAMKPWSRAKDIVEKTSIAMKDSLAGARSVGAEDSENPYETTPPPPPLPIKKPRARAKKVTKTEIAASTVPLESSIPVGENEAQILAKPRAMPTKNAVPILATEICDPSTQLLKETLHSNLAMNPVKKARGRPRKGVSNTTKLVASNPFQSTASKMVTAAESHQTIEDPDDPILAPELVTKKLRSRTKQSAVARVLAPSNSRPRANKAASISASTTSFELAENSQATTSSKTSVFDLPSDEDGLLRSRPTKASLNDNNKPRKRKSLITYKSPASRRTFPDNIDGEYELESDDSITIKPAPSTPSAAIIPTSSGPPKTNKKSVPQPPSSTSPAKPGFGMVHENPTPSGKIVAFPEEEYSDRDAEGETDEDYIGSNGIITTRRESARVSAGGASGRVSVGGTGGRSSARISYGKISVDVEGDKRKLSHPTPARQTPNDKLLVGIKDPFLVPEGRGSGKAEKATERMGVDERIREDELEIAAKPQTLAKGKMKEKERRKIGVQPTQKAVKFVKNWVLQRLMGRRNGNLVGVEEEYNNVHNLLEQTIVAGEGNSMLVIGGRGSGKSMLVETAIADLTQDHKGEFLVVRLNGFFQTDDKIALKEIWRQLGVEMELNEQEQSKATNFADTLSSILAILSHPDELQPEGPDTDPVDQGESPDSSCRTTLSVIFVLDEFDLFVTHPRQTLLYNLFDIAQARKAPIAVIGLTCRIDVVESLEKRVKSRFSHRSVHLRLPNGIGKFWDRCKEALKVNLGELEEREGELEPAERKWIEEWNGSLEVLIKEDKIFERMVERIYAQSKDLKAFFNVCLMPVAELSVENPVLRGEAFVGNELAAPESKLHVLDGLTELELSLLIAAARLDIVSDTDTCNFSMAYDEYKGLISKIKIQSSAAGVSGGKLWGREVALGAWERLAEYELIVPALVGGGSAAGGVGREGRMWRVDVGLTEIGKSVRGLSAVMAKWCKEV